MEKSLDTIQTRFSVSREAWAKLRYEATLRGINVNQLAAQILERWAEEESK